MASRERAAYRRAAIDILMQVRDGKVEPLPIIQEFAKHHPKALCDALAHNPWELQAKIILRTEGKVPAIKYVRHQTGLGLKEAKELVDRMEAA